MAARQSALTASSGTPYGHVPGHQYHDIEGTLEQTRYGWRCTLLETWGSAQGRDEEHGRQTSSGRGDTPHAAVAEAKAEALALDMHKSFIAATCAELLTQAEDAADNS